MQNPPFVCPGHPSSQSDWWKNLFGLVSLRHRPSRSQRALSQAQPLVRCRPNPILNSDTEHNDSGRSIVSALCNAGQKVRQLLPRAVTGRLSVSRRTKCDTREVSSTARLSSSCLTAAKAPHTGTAEERSPQRTVEEDFSEPTVRNDASKPLHDVQDHPSKGDEELREEERDMDSCTMNTVLTTTGGSRLFTSVVHAKELASGVEDEFVIAGQAPTVRGLRTHHKLSLQLLRAILTAINENMPGPEGRRSPQSKRFSYQIALLVEAEKTLERLLTDFPGYCTPALARVIIEDRILADYLHSRSQSRHRSQQTSTEVSAESLPVGLLAKLDTPEISHQNIQMTRNRLRRSSYSVSTTSVVDRIEPSDVGSEDAWQPSLL
ncbi:hypothetical protein AX15_006167 [Amanita polypyramis BW_CC]|nr:hypothetical protein AX15_006167 [Amanita polypyramis BW_CC]